MVRGSAAFELVEGVVPEYSVAARRYFGDVQGDTWIRQLGGMVSRMARITIKPEWVGLLDFQTRFPSALGI
jgi:hypothetical protein